MKRKILYAIGGLSWIGVVVFVFHQIPKFHHIYEDFDLPASIVERMVLEFAGPIVLVAAIVSAAAMRKRNQLIPLIVVPVFLFVAMWGVLMFRIGQLASEL